MSTFKRSFHLISQLKNDTLYTKIKKDIDRGVIFPAVRNRKMCFYCGGSRPFVYDGKFSTHRKYISLLLSNKDYLSEADLINPRISKSFVDCYEAVIDNCQKYAGLEAQGVSHLYSKYSYANKSNKTQGIVVLDIEVAIENEDEDYDNKQDRIDLLLYSIEEKALKFVEAKHFTNSELWSKENTKPEVANQIERYNRQIEEKSAEIIAEYGNYINIVNTLFGLQLPIPDKLLPKCGLYIFGFDRDQQTGRFKRLLRDDGSLEGIKHYDKGDPKKDVKIQTLWNYVTKE